MTLSCKVKKWHFSNHPFFEWGPKDEEICRKYGWGKEVEEEEITSLPKVEIIEVDFVNQNIICHIPNWDDFDDLYMIAVKNNIAMVM